MTAPYMAASNLNKPPLGETGCLSNPYFDWLLRHSVFWFTSLFPTQPVRLPLVAYPSICSTCMSYRERCSKIVELSGKHVKSHEILLDYFEENKGQICLEYLPPLGNLVAYQFYNDIVAQDKILKWTFNEYLKKSRKNRSSNEIQFKWTFMTA